MKPGTTFLLMDVQSYVSKGGMDRAVVFQGVDGIGEFVRMLYAKKDLYAYNFSIRKTKSQQYRGGMGNRISRGSYGQGERCAASDSSRQPG